MGTVTPTKKVYATNSIYAAAGDGVTDDTAALTAAFTAAKAGNRCIHIPAGTYLVNARLVTLTDAHSGFTITSDGRGVTIIKFSANLANPCIEIIGTDIDNHAEFIQCLGITIDGAGFTGTGLYIEKADKLAFQKSEIVNVSGPAVDAVEFWDSDLDLKVFNCGRSATSEPSLRFKPTATATSATGCNNIRFSHDTQIEQMNYRAVELWEHSQDFTIHGKTHGKASATPDYEHFALLGAYNNRINGVNMSQGPATKALVTLQTSTSVESNDNHLTENQFIDGAYGVDVVFGRRNYLTYNDFNLNSSASIRVQGGGDNVVTPNNSQDTTFLAAGSDAYLRELTSRQQTKFIRDGAASGAVVKRVGLRQSGTPTDFDFFAIRYMLLNDNGDEFDFAEDQLIASDVTDGSEDGQFTRRVAVAGSLTDLYRVRAGAIFDVSQGLRVRNGATLTHMLKGTTSYNPGTVADGASVNTTVTVTGAAAGDLVAITHAGLVADVQASGFVSASNTVTATFTNHSGGNWAPGAGTLTAIVWRI